MDRQAIPDFFDFLRGRDAYADRQIERLNWRRRHIVEPILPELKGATLLDLGSHDGRWPYAFAAAGASVTGIEGRGELISQFDSRFPDPATRARVNLVEGDFVQEMDRLIAEGRRFDVVACLGVFYHTMQHYRMLVQFSRFKPKLIIIDSEFAKLAKPVIQITKERTDKPLNSIAQTDGQPVVPVGKPSRPALKMMATSLGYAIEWVTWDVPEELRPGVVGDYFPSDSKSRRFTAILRPGQSPRKQPQ